MPSACWSRGSRRLQQESGGTGGAWGRRRRAPGRPAPQRHVPRPGRPQPPRPHGEGGTAAGRECPGPGGRRCREGREKAQGASRFREGGCRRGRCCPLAAPPGIPAVPWAAAGTQGPAAAERAGVSRWSAGVGVGLWAPLSLSPAGNILRRARPEPRYPAGGGEGVSARRARSSSRWRTRPLFLLPGSPWRRDNSRCPAVLAVIIDVWCWELLHSRAIRAVQRDRKLGITTWKTLLPCRWCSAELPGGALLTLGATILFKYVLSGV